MVVGKLVLVAIWIIFVHSNFVVADEKKQSVVVPEISFSPEIDGDVSDWKSIPGKKLKLKSNGFAKKSNRNELLLKSGIYKDHIYLCAVWADKQKNDTHKTWVWSKKRNRYIRGPEREDRFALQWAMSGDYSTNWLSGKTFKADMWHWKAKRSNPLGLAHDKYTIISTTPIPRSTKIRGDNGSMVYIFRASDMGTKLYDTKRYGKHRGNRLPKYILNHSAHGSVTDVKAKGIWKNGVWSLELKRKLNTGNSDDVVFSKGSSVLGGIAIFDASDDNIHLITDTLSFKM